MCIIDAEPRLSRYDDQHLLNAPASSGKHQFSQHFNRMFQMFHYMAYHH